MFILFKCVKSKTMTIQQLKILYLPITLFDKRWQSACYFKISGIPPVSKDHNFLNVVEYTKRVNFKLSIYFITLNKSAAHYVAFHFLCMSYASNYHHFVIAMLVDYPLNNFLTLADKFFFESSIFNRKAHFNTFK